MSSLYARLLEHLDTFIKMASGELFLHIGELLNEMFTASISFSVKEEQIQKILKIVFAKGEEKYPLRNSVLMGAVQELLLVMID